ncbi:MAG: hypothetical protein HYV53_03045 [Parcubacteria group bacterium]|nr:hypothetical protein [Parcubacteria group bacterium]
MFLISKYNKIIFFSLMIVWLFLIVAPTFLAFALPARAAAGDLDLWGGKKNDIRDKTGLSDDKDPRDIAADIIRVILGFLGIIAVIIILLGGFKWMTAGGNEDKVDEAKKLIIAGVIGLLIIIASFAIATFVLNSLIKATKD